VIGDLGSIASRSLGHVERRIGQAFEPLRGVGMSGKRSHTEARGDRDIGARQRDFGDRGAYSLGNLEAGSGVGFGEQQRKLLAPLRPAKSPARSAPRSAAPNVREHLVTNGNDPAGR